MNKKCKMQIDKKIRVDNITEWSMDSIIKIKDYVDCLQITADEETKMTRAFVPLTRYIDTSMAVQHNINPTRAMHIHGTSNFLTLCQ